jgi:VWFA-related protein
MRRLAILAAVWLGVGAAQEPIIRGGVQLVDLLVTVRDKRGAVVNDLTQSDFKILEDGKQQEIRSFTRQTEVPLTIGMLVDISGSVAEQVAKERIAAGEFFQHVLHPQDQAFLVSFARSAVLLQDLTPSVGKLQQGLQDLLPERVVNGNPNVVMAQFPGPRFPMPAPPRRGRYPGSPTGRGGTVTLGGTVLYDAVFLAADEVLKPTMGRKAIILITDGDDQGSKVSLNTAIEAAQRSDVIVYSIQVRSAMGRIVASLDRISTETGGRVFRLEGKMTKIFNQISEELRSQYAISYSSSNASQGGYHQIDVQMASKNHKPTARKGYYGRETVY